jgi:hypothetical protein
MGYVYFIQAGKRGDIKIGYSTNIKKRISTLQTAMAEKIKLLGYITGNSTTEKELHYTFRILRKKGEWFICDASIINYLNTVNEMKLRNNMDVVLEMNENNEIMLYGKIKKV